jgi:hypothetical protein
MLDPSLTEGSREINLYAYAYGTMREDLLTRMRRPFPARRAGVGEGSCQADCLKRVFSDSSQPGVTRCPQLCYLGAMSIAPRA